MAKAEYWNAFVEDSGRRYRIPFHVGSGRVMLVALQPLHASGKERLMTVDGRRARELLDKARELLKQYKDQVDG